MPKPTVLTGKEWDAKNKTKKKKEQEAAVREYVTAYEKKKAADSTQQKNSIASAVSSIAAQRAAQNTANSVKQASRQAQQAAHSQPVVKPNNPTWAGETVYSYKDKDYTKSADFQKALSMTKPPKQVRDVDMDDFRVNSWYFLHDMAKNAANITYGKDQTLSKDYTKEWAKLNEQRNVINAYLNWYKRENGKSYDEDLENWIKEWDANSQKLSTEIGKRERYYSQWVDQDHYRREAYQTRQAVAEQQKYLDYDVTGEEQRIAEMDDLLEQARQLDTESPQQYYNKYTDNGRNVSRDTFAQAEAQYEAHKNSVSVRQNALAREHGFKDYADLLAQYEQAKAQYDELAEEAKRRQAYTTMEADATSDPRFLTYAKQRRTEKYAAEDAAKKQKEEYENLPAWQRRVMDVELSDPQEIKMEDRGYYTERELDVYYYYKALEKAGEVPAGTAQKYLDSIQYDYNLRGAQKKFDDLDNNTGLELTFQFAAGLDQAVTGWKKWFDNSDYITPTQTEIASSMVREDLTKKHGFLGQAASDLVVTTANMIPSIMAGAVLGEAVTGVAAAGRIAAGLTLGGSAGGHAYAEMVNKGYTKGQARLYGAVNGALEAALEYALNGIEALGGSTGASYIKKVLTEAADGIGNAGFRWAAVMGANLAADAVSEATEESLQEVLAPFVHWLITGDWEGIDIKEVAYSGLLGALSSVPFNVTSGAINFAGDVATPKDMNALVELGRQFDEGALTRQLTEGIDTERGKPSIRDRVKGAMAMEVAGDEVRTQMQRYVQDMFRREGIDAENTEYLTELAIDKINGTELSDRQTKKLAAMDSGNGKSVSRIFDRVVNKASDMRSNVSSLQTAYARAAGVKNAQYGMDFAAKSKYEKAKAAMDSERSAALFGVDLTENGTKVNAETGVQPVEIATIKDGKMTLRLTDGRTVDSDTVKYKSRSAAMIYDGVRKLGADTATSNKLVKSLIVGAATGNAESMPAQVMDMRRAFVAGMTGDQNAEPEGMGEAQWKYIYGLGQIYAKGMEAKRGALKNYKANAQTATEQQRETAGRIERELASFDATVSQEKEQRTAEERLALLRDVRAESAEAAKAFDQYRDDVQALQKAEAGLEAANKKIDALSEKKALTKAEKQELREAKTQTAQEQNRIDILEKRLARAEESGPIKDLFSKAVPKKVKLRAGDQTAVVEMIGIDEANLTNERKTAILALNWIVKNITKNRVVMFESVKKSDGTRIYAVDFAGKKAGDPADNGFYDQATGTVYIDINAGNKGEGTIMWTAAHEFTHFMRQFSPESFEKLAKYLMRVYGERGHSLDYFVRQEQARYAATGDKLSADVALEEVVARSMEKLFTDADLMTRLAEIKAQNRTAWEKLKEYFSKLSALLHRAHKDRNASTEEAKLIAGMTDRIDKIADMFAEGLVKAGENYEAIAPNQVKATADAAAEAMYSRRLDSKMMDDVEAYNTLIPAHLLPVVRAQRELVKTLLQKAEYDPITGKRKLLLPEDIDGKGWVSNGSYGRSMEPATVCVRSIGYDALCDMIAKKLGRPLKMDEALAVSQNIGLLTNEIQCKYCYVAADRMAYREAVYTFLKDRDRAIAALQNGEISTAKQFEEVYRRGRKSTEGKYGTQALARFYVDGIKNGMKVIPSSYVADLSNDPDRIADITKRLTRDGYNTEELTRISKYAQNASWAKKRTKYKAYTGDILKWSNDVIKKLNREFGLRFYSFADFSPAFILENMQEITDAAARGLKGLAYTKDLDFVRIFAPSNININISLFGTMKNGVMTEDAMQGASWDEAKALRDKYDNVGLVFVATNDEAVNWALDQDWIDVVIPYHTVRSGEKMTAFFSWKDYKSSQEDKIVGSKAKEDRKGLSKAIFPQQHNNDFDTYMAELKRNNLAPRFPEFIDNPNYMKLVNETRRSAKDTPAMLPVFDMAAAKASIEKMVKSGGYFKTLGGSMAAMEVFSEMMAGEIAQTADVDLKNINLDTTAFGKILAELQDELNVANEYTADADTEGTSDAVLHSHRETDKKTLDFLNNQEYVTTYRTMQIVNGELHSPMAAKVDGKWTDAYEFGKWYRSDERPDLAFQKQGKEGWFFRLNKGNGKSIDARYNPYEHTSNSVINDQFAEAYKRPNLVVVEMRVPKSELTAGYQAEYAKDPVGWMKWKSGATSTALAKKGFERKVLLSRWAMPVRKLEDAEVAAIYKDLLSGTGIEVADNTVTPGLLEELKKQGVAIKESGLVEGSEIRRSARDNLDAQIEMARAAGNQTDVDYLIAVRDGNTETAQRMVDEAAKRAGYTIKAYHGTANAGRFNIFDPKKLNNTKLSSHIGQGFYFTNLKSGAQEYMQESDIYGNRKKGSNPYLFEGYIKLQNPIEVSYNSHVLTFDVLRNIIADGDKQWFFTNGIPHELQNQEILGQTRTKAEISSLSKEEKIDLYVRSLLPYGDIAALSSMVGAYSYGNQDLLLNAMKKYTGNDGIHWKQREGLDQFVVFDSSQFKESAPITYDDAGNVIPLSERFDETQGDIRYSLRPDPIIEKKNIADGKAAVQTLIEKSKTSANPEDLIVESAMYRTDIGYIDFKWGTPGKGSKFKNGYGISHVIAKRDAEDGNGINVAYDLVECIAQATFYDIQRNDFVDDDNYRIRLYYKDIVAVLSKDPGQKHWLLTGWKEKETAANASGEGYDSSAATAVTPTHTRRNGDATVPNNTITETSSDVNHKSSRRDNYDTSARTLLSNALLDVAQNDIERKRLEEYQAKIGDMEAEQVRLGELNREIRELSSGKAPRDNERLKTLRDEARKTANRITIYDKQLLRLEASRPLDRVLVEETRRVAGEAAAKAREEERAKRDRDVLGQRISRLANERKLKREKREAVQKVRDVHTSADLRKRIKRIRSDFEQALKNGNERTYIPAPLVKGIIAVCEAIDPTGPKQDSQAAQRYRSGLETLGQLKVAYDSLKNSPDYDLKSEFRADFSDRISALADAIGETPLREMNREQLQDVYDILHDIQHTVRDAKKQIREGAAISNYQTGQQIINTLRTVRANNLRGTKAGDLLRTFMTNPLRAVQEMSGFQEDSELTRLMYDIDRGLRDADTFRMNATKELDALRKTKEDRKAFNEATEKAFDFGLKDVDGNDLKISKMQAMQILLTYDREQYNKNRKHLENVMFIPDVDLMRKGKIAEALEKAQEMPALTDDTINKISANLNAWDMRFMDAARRVFYEMSSDAVNRTSMLMIGRPIATESHYIPYEIMSDYLSKESENVDFNISVANMGMTKSMTPNARQPLVMRGLNAVLDKHIDDVAKYSGLSVPVRNWNKAINVKQRAEDGNSTVKWEIRRTWGADGEELLDQAVADVQGPRRGDKSKILNAIKSGFVVSTLAGNISVTIKQAASYPTAGVYLDGTALTKGAVSWIGLGKNGRMALLDEIDEHTPMNWTRRQGLSTQELGEINQSTGWVNKVNRKLGNWSPMNWIQAVDVNTTAALWLACKAQVEKSGLKTGTEEYWNAVTELYDKVIEDTQPMYDPLHRAEITKNDKYKFVMFQTQPIQNSGILREATYKFKDAKKIYGKNSAQAKAAGTQFKKAVASQLASHFVFTAMTLLASAILHRMNNYRDKDKEITAASVSAEFMMQWVQNMFSAIFPVIGNYAFEFAETMVNGRGYDILTDPVLDKINGTVTYLTKLKDPNYKTLVAAATDIAGYFGVPVSIYKLGEGIVRNAIDAVNGEFLRFENDVSRTAAVERHRLYEALLEGDTAKVEKLKQGYKTADDYHAAIRTALGENDERIVEASVARQNGDLETYKKLVQEIADEGVFDLADIKRTANSKVTSLRSGIKKATEAFENGWKDDYEAAIKTLVNAGFDKKYVVEQIGDVAYQEKPGWWTEAEEAENAEKVPWYKDEDVQAAFAEGNKDELDMVFDDLVAYYEAKDKTDPEKSARGKMKTTIGDAYTEGAISEQKAKQYLKDYAGLDDDAIYWNLDEWNYDDDGDEDSDWSKYAEFTDAVAAGGSLSGVINKYTDHGVEPGDLTSAISKAYKKQYQTANGSEKTALGTKLIKAYQAVYEEAGKDDKDKDEWRIQKSILDKWQYEADTGEEKGYSIYNDYYEAVATGKDVKTVTKEYLDHVEKKTLASQITEHFKPIYVAASNSERSRMKGYLLNAYELLGYKRSDKSKDIDAWLKQKK